MVIYSASTSQSQQDFFFRVYCLGPQIERSLSWLLVFCFALFFVCFFSERWHFTIHQFALSLALSSVSSSRLSTFLAVCYKYFIFLSQKSRRDLHSIQVHLIVWSFLFSKNTSTIQSRSNKCDTLVSVNEKGKTIH